MLVKGILNMTLRFQSRFQNYWRMKPGNEEIWVKLSDIVKTNAVDYARALYREQISVRKEFVIEVKYMIVE
jgi:hypothetical protein